MTYRLEVWQAPDGTIVRAVLPPEIQGSHFGHQLRALLHNLYALGMTEPGLFDLLRSSGIEISEGQVGVASENGKIRTLALGIFGAFCIGSYLISISECILFTMS